MITVYSGQAGSNVITVEHVKPVSEKTARKRVNNELWAVCSNRYYNSIPLTTIDEILTRNGFQETEEGIYCGRDGQVHEQIGPNTWLTLTWHKMESGRYEVNAYVS